jgi:hypothetical protein
MPLRQVLSLQPYVGLTVLVDLLALPGLGSAVGALFLFRLVGETFHDSAKKALQGLVPEERRGRVSLVLESVMISVGTISGATRDRRRHDRQRRGERFDPRAGLPGGGAGRGRRRPCSPPARCAAPTRSAS